KMFGSGYGEAALVIRGLALLPALRVLQYFPGNALSGAGYYRFRSACQAGTAALNVGLNVLLIPRLGWRGAVFATIAAETVFAAALWWMLAVLMRRERRAVAVVIEAPASLPDLRADVA